MLNHDESKYKSPEYIPYVYTSWVYKTRSEGKDWEIPEELQTHCDNATWHHIKINKHHPEFWDNTLTVNPQGFGSDRDNPKADIVDATTMPQIWLIAMAADWCACSEENDNTPFEWGKTHINKRWKFTKKQVDFFYDCLKELW